MYVVGIGIDYRGIDTSTHELKRFNAAARISSLLSLSVTAPPLPPPPLSVSDADDSNPWVASSPPNQMLYGIYMDGDL